MKRKIEFNKNESAKITIMNEAGNVIKSIFDSFDSIKHAKAIVSNEPFAVTFSISQENGHYSIHNA